MIEMALFRNGMLGYNVAPSKGIPSPSKLNSLVYIRLSPSTMLDLKSTSP